MQLLLIMLGVFFLLVFLKIPIAFSLGLASVIPMLYLNIGLTRMVNSMYSSINSFPLLAVPLFLFLGRLMNEGGITKRLVNFSDSLLGHVQGGLGHVNVLVSMLFAGLSGSATADTAGIGAMLIPAMKESDFSTEFSVAITAMSSTLGVIIPPSIFMVIYGSLGQVSIGALFLAGVIPGILIGISQMIYVYYNAKKNNFPIHQRVSLKELGITTIQALPALLLPLIILGGVISGVFTATEAAAVAVVYGLFLMFIVYRSYRIRDLPIIFKDTVINYALPMFAVASAGVMGWLIAFMGAPQIISASILNITQSYFGIYMFLTLFLLLIGTFLSPITTIIIFLPIIRQLGAAAGFHPVHLGVIVVMVLSMGMVTPPYGMCLLVAAQIGEISPIKAFSTIIPLLAITLFIIVLCILFPSLLLFLPRLLMPQYM